MHNNIDLASTESDLHINSPRRHEEHEEKPKKNLRVLRVFVVKCLKYRVPETLILACARKALFRPTQFLVLNLHLEFGKVKVRKLDD